MRQGSVEEGLESRIAEGLAEGKRGWKQAALEIQDWREGIFVVEEDRRWMVHLMGECMHWARHRGWEQQRWEGHWPVKDGVEEVEQKNCPDTPRTVAQLYLSLMGSALGDKQKHWTVTYLWQERRRQAEDNQEAGQIERRAVAPDIRGSQAAP